MNSYLVLLLLLFTVIVMMVGSVVFRSPKQNIKNAVTEGAVWSAGFCLAFGAETLFLIRN